MVKLLLLVLLTIIVAYSFALPPKRVLQYDPFVPSPGSQVYQEGEA